LVIDEVLVERALADVHDVAVRRASMAAWIDA
jgi:hypothetical protein